MYYFIINLNSDRSGEIHIVESKDKDSPRCGSALSWYDIEDLELMWANSFELPYYKAKNNQEYIYSVTYKNDNNNRNNLSSPVWIDGEEIFQALSKFEVKMIASLFDGVEIDGKKRNFCGRCMATMFTTR